MLGGTRASGEGPKPEGPALGFYSQKALDVYPRAQQGFRQITDRLWAGITTPTLPGEEGRVRSVWGVD